MLYTRGGQPFLPQAPILFKSSSMRRTNERFQNINSESISDFPIFRPKIIMFSKKKKSLYSESISDFPIFRPKIRWSSDIARYNLWNVFHLKYFPRLQCATGWPPLLYTRTIENNKKNFMSLRAPRKI